MIVYLRRRLLSIGFILVLGLILYLLGRAHAGIGCARRQNQTLEKKVEIIKYVEKKKQQIYSAPHITRDSALELFERGIL